MNKRKDKPMKANQARLAPEEVVREFPPIARYRIRLLAAEGAKERTLDIREYVSSETFEGLC